MNRLTVAACSFALAAAIPAAAQKEVQSAGPHRHAGAGAVYQTTVGEFRRGKVYRYDEHGNDVSAGYDLAAPDGRILLTVYIYPAPAAAKGRHAAVCQEEFRAVVQAMLANRAEAVRLDEGEALPVAGVPASLSHRAAYRFAAQFDGKVQPIRSEGHLYCYVGGEWFVKYRVSTPLSVEARQAVETFIRTGPFPGR